MEENKNIHKEELKPNEKTSKKTEVIERDKKSSVKVIENLSKQKIAILKLCKKKRVKSVLFNKKLLEYVDEIDVAKMALETIGVNEAKEFQTVILEGYDYNDSDKAICLDKNNFVSTSYNKTALIFYAKKIILYTYTFSFLSDKLKTECAEIYYDSISFISLKNEIIQKSYGKDEMVYVNSSYLDISAGEDFMIPLDNVHKFSDKPVLSEMIKFIESKKSL